MKTLKIHIALIIVLIFNTAIKAQWNAVRFDETNTFLQVNTVDSNNVFVIGKSPNSQEVFLLRTDDGGTTWDSVSLNNDLLKVVYDMQFIDKINGFVNAWDGSFRKLIKTQDSGNTWTDISPSATISHIGAIQFISNNLGYIISTDSVGSTVLNKTTDGGKIWEKELISFDVTDLYFIDKNNGFATTSEGNQPLKGAQIMKTSDGGKNWHSIFSMDNPNLFVSQFDKLDFIDSQTLFTSVSDVIYKTLDGGISWDTIIVPFSNSPSYIRDFDFISALNGYLLSTDGEIFVTQDGGITWKLEYSTQWDLYGPQVSFNALSFRDNVGFVVGSNGLIKKRKKNKTTGVKIVGNSGMLSLYPNPTKGILNVSTDKGQLNLIKILNLQGQVVFQKDVNENMLTLSLSHLPKGIYLLETTNLLLTKTVNKIILE